MEEIATVGRLPIAKISSSPLSASVVEESTDRILRLLYKDRNFEEKNSKCWPSDDEYDTRAQTKDHGKIIVEESKPIENKREMADGPISVTFNVRAQTQFGEELYIVGSLSSLGGWDPTHAMKLSTNKESYPNWSVTVTLTSRIMEYKYIIMREKTFVWEEFTTNRALNLMGCGLWTFVDDGLFNKLTHAQVVNTLSLEILYKDLETLKTTVQQQQEEKLLTDRELENERHKCTELMSEVNILKKQIGILEGTKLETLSMSDLKTLVHKSKKTAHKANLELTKRLENEIYHLQRMRDCAVCMDKPIDTVCLPCGHLALCTDCAVKLHSRCVICNVQITQIQKVFMK